MTSLLRKVLRRLRKGRGSAASAAKSQAKAKARAERAELKTRASAAVAAGAWDEACTAYRRLGDRNGGKVSTRYALAKALQRKYLVPFAVDGQAVARTRPAERESAFAQALRELEAVVEAEPRRVRSTYFLGRHFEYAGRYAEAAEIYRLALSRLETADEAWAHASRLAWTFRLGWVTRRLDPGAEPADGAEPRLLRFVAPAEAAATPDGPAAPNPAESAAADPAGFFDATVTDRGLSVSGFVLPGRPEAIDLHLDDRFLVRITADPRQPLRAFAITLTHAVLDEFGTRSALTARCGEANLVNRGGGTDLVVEVPDGTGKLPVLLDSGHRVNKKGRLSQPGDESTGLGPAYFQAYRIAREVFAEKLDLPLFLAYGTLLGCYRDGRLIPGDDDFDVAYLSFATEPQGVKDEAADVMAELVRAGFDVRVAIDGRAFHLGVNGVGIDVNPLWQHQGRVYGYTGHAVARSALESVTPLDLGDGAVDVPVGAEAFLAATYGPDWRTPAPGFRYYRDEADLKLLRQARLLPSEVAAFEKRAQKLRAEDANAGGFGGYAAPDNPDFDLGSRSSPPVRLRLDRGRVPVGAVETVLRSMDR